MDNLEATSSNVTSSQPFDNDETSTSMNDENPEEIPEEVPEEIPTDTGNSLMNFVTKNTFRSQSNVPDDKPTVEDLWRRSLEQEANFRTRYWAMIGGVVLVAVVAIIAVVAPLAAQKDQYKIFEDEINKLHAKENDHLAKLSPELNSIRGKKFHPRKEPVGGIYSTAYDSTTFCGKVEPLNANSLGPMWECAIRDWEQWDATNGSVLSYMCATDSGCKMMLTGRCVGYSWRYLKMTNNVSCGCSNLSKMEDLMHKIKAKLNRTKRVRRIKRDYGRIIDNSNWTKTHCTSDPPTSWGCAKSDWNPNNNELGYNTKSMGYVVNYLCTTRLKGCTVVRTLECGANKLWKVIFSSSIVNDCVCHSAEASTNSSLSSSSLPSSTSSEIAN